MLLFLVLQQLQCELSPSADAAQSGSCRASRIGLHLAPATSEHGSSPMSTTFTACTRHVVQGHHLQAARAAWRPWCLFLDVDGTLLDFAATPAAVQVPPGLRQRLYALRHLLGGALALISGRTLD